MSEADAKRAINFFQRARVRYLAASGHNYPYEVPEFVVEIMCDVLAKSRAPQTAATK